MKSYQQHLDSLRTLAFLAGKSSDLDMRTKQASLNWLADRFAELEKERDRLQEDLSPHHLSCAEIERSFSQRER